jgi:uncharacterized membrane protein (UPF0127 family)
MVLNCELNGITEQECSPAGSIIAVFLKYLTVLLLLACTGQGLACPVANKYIRITASGHELNTEVATNHAGHMCGLAFRRDLPADHGMLFVYEQNQIIGFWMKDTYIHLSIAFLDADGKILEIHDMDPRYPTRRYISKLPARYALEVNQGWFSKNGIKAGNRIDLDLQNDPDIFRYSQQ